MVDTYIMAYPKTKVKGMAVNLTGKSTQNRMKKSAEIRAAPPSVREGDHEVVEGVRHTQMAIPTQHMYDSVLGSL